ncbi:MAG: T9SS type A sorting domain-containing protein, partial [Flavobacteriales bacterium]
IGEESWHTLTVRPGVDLPTGTFNATLELWTGFYEDLACSWELPVLLCTDAPCSPLVPFVQNYGSGLALGDFQHVISSGGSPVAGGTFTLTADDQLASDTVCLPPGNYVMELTADQPSTGGEPVFGVNGEDRAQGPSANVGFDVPASLTFAFHGPCIDIAQHVVIRNPDVLRVIQGADHIQLIRTDGQALGVLNVFDAQGRVVYSTRTSQAECTIPTGDRPAGIFMLRVSSGKQPLVVKVMLP